MEKDYRSLEHKIRDIVAEASMNRNTDLRRKVVNVGRPDTAPSNFDDKSKLAKQGEIKTKIIDEAKDKEADKKDKKDDSAKDDKESKAGASKAEDEFTGGKTEVDFEPKTDDKVVVDSDDKPKKTKKVTKEETMLKSDNKFGLPQDLIDAVNEAMKRKPTEEELKGNQHKIDKNKNGKIDAHDFKLLRKEETEEIDEVSKDLLKRSAEKAEKDYAVGAKKGGDIYTDKQMKKRNDQSWKFRAAASQKEEVEIDEAVKTDNEGHGYHGEAYHAAKGENKMAEAGKAFAKAHSLVKKHAAEHLKNAKNPNKMVKHYLDSQHGRHLHGNENDAAYVKKDFAHFAKKYKPEMHEEVEQLDEIGDTPKGKAVLNRYIKKAGKNVEKHSDVMFNKHNKINRKMAAGDKDAENKYAYHSVKYDQRLKGMETAKKKLNKEEVEQIDEISARKAMDYSIKSAANVGSGKGGDKEDKRIAGQKIADEKYRKMQGKSSSAKVAATEEVELSDAEIARLEEIAKGL